MWKSWYWATGILCVGFLKNEIQAASVLLKKAYNCPNIPNPTPMTMDIKIKRTFPNNSQLTEFALNVPYDIHTNTKATAKIEHYALGKVWTTLTKFESNKGMCTLFNDNGGELWFETQRAIGMPERRCPIPQGNYHSDNMFLYLTKYKVPVVPPGNYRGTIEVRNKANNSLLLCKMFDIEDKA